MPIVSVIVPVYNTEQYLPQCIDSILTQTFNDFELILVNDGSTDNSGKLCDEYEKLDNRIIVFHKENEGANSARKEGVNIASGEWITFVDSDDTIMNDALYILCNNSCSQTDIVIGQIDRSLMPLSGTYSYKEYQKLIFHGKITPGPVAKLFRKNLFDKHVFEMPNSIKVGEDMLMNIRISFRLQNNVKVLSDVTYCYLQRQNSSFNTFTPSIKYEDSFFYFLKRSIPPNKYYEFEEDLFIYTFGKYCDFCGYKTIVTNDWINSELNKFIELTKSKYYYKISLVDKMLLSTTNKYIRFLLILLKKINNHVPRCLKVQ